MEAEPRMVASGKTTFAMTGGRRKTFWPGDSLIGGPIGEKTEVTGRDGDPIEVVDAREALLSRVQDIMAKRDCHGDPES